MFKKAILFSLLFIFTTFIFAQDLDKIFKDRIEVYFTFQANSVEAIHSLSRVISIDNVTEDMQVYAYANKQEFTKFLGHNMDYTVLQAPGTLHHPRMLDDVDIKNITSWDFYPTYDAYVDMMYQFESDFPSICDVYSIGTTNEGREILVARISDNLSQPEGEPEFFYTSSMHGDETTGYVLMLRLIDYLLNGYGNNARLTNMVDNIDIYINPLANPDGSYHGGNNSIYGAQRYNANGVDINRNFPDPEDGPHPDGYPWQTETIHFMNFAEAHNINMSANLHGGIEVLNYPWDTWYRLAADNSWWVYVCREYADTVHEHAPSNYLTAFQNGITNGYQWYTISGGRQDYMNYFHQAREMTLEISDTKLLPASQLPAHWEYNYRSFLNYIEQCMYGIRGIITDSSTGLPLKAEVYVLDHELDSSWVYSSSEAGNYHRLLDSVTYDIRFSKTNYYSQVFYDVKVNRLNATLINVELVKVSADIEEQIAESFSIYPNPASGNFIKVKGEKEIGQISIFSMTGKLCYQVEAAGKEISFVDVSSLDSGVYIIRIETEGKYFQQKLIRP